MMKTVIVNDNKITTKLIHAAVGTRIVFSDCCRIFSLSPELLEEPLVVFSGCITVGGKSQFWLIFFKHS